MSGKQRKKQVLTYIALLLGGFFALYGAIDFGENVYRLSMTGTRTAGVIYDVQKVQRRIAGKTTTDLDVMVVYKTATGTVQRFLDKKNPKVVLQGMNFQPRDKVSVLYLPDHPQEAMIDTGAFIWLVPGGLAALSFVLLFIGVFSLRKMSVDTYAN